MISEGTVALARRLRVVALVVLLLGGAMIPLAGFFPISLEGEPVDVARRRPVRGMAEGPKSVEPLLGKLAGRRLIRPAQVQAAVQDGGVAAKLLKQLTLRGVAQRNGGRAAYVEVEKGGTKVVRKGDTLLGFLVEDVAPGRVSLSLEGVLLELNH